MATDGDDGDDGDNCDDGDDSDDGVGDDGDDGNDPYRLYGAVDKGPVRAPTDPRQTRWRANSDGV